MSLTVFEFHMVLHGFMLLKNLHVLKKLFWLAC